MNKQFYKKVTFDLKNLENRTVSYVPVTQAELNEFRKEATEMLEIMNGVKEYIPAEPKVKMSTQKGFKPTKYELKLGALIRK
jgi:hypothetical protein